MQKRTGRILSLVLDLEILLFHFTGFSNGQTTEPSEGLFSRLKALPGVYVRKIDALPGFKEGFEIAVVQPVDHNNPKGPKFTQRVFLSHRDVDKPVVLETEGYGATWPKEREAAKILEANQILVEHRYYESSRPKSVNWKYLTSWQAASDHHRIVELLKGIYPGKWVTSGRSKGGMAALFQRAFYPGDVDATIAYVAPIMLGPTDPRIEDFVNSVGDEACREKIRQFQRTCLERRNELLPLLKELAGKGRLSFPCSLDSVFEWAVIEFSYSFWSGNHKGEEIPRPDAPKEEVFHFLDGVNSFSGLSSKQIRFNAALYFQQYTEFGYFRYPVSHFQDLLEFVKEPHFSFYVPKDARNAVFDETVMPRVLHCLQNEGNNIIYLYGEHDVWTSCAVTLTGKTNAIKLICRGKGHLFDITDFPEDEKEKIFTALESWLNVRITSPKGASDRNRP
jgi:hypothetical protein